MKVIIILCFLFSFENVYADYCIFDGNQRKGCYSSLYACKDVLTHVRAGMSRNDECRQHEVKTNYPPSLKASAPNAYCIWLFHDGGFKNMGCMEKVTCDYSMQQYPHTICAKGSITDLAEIKKIYLTHEKKVHEEERAIEKKKVKLENELFARGDANEIAHYIKDKYGRLEITSPNAVAAAQKKLEPFCASGNQRACFVLYDLFHLSDFKEKWKRSAEAQCNDLKKSYEYLFRSCLLGYNKACEEVISKDQLDGGIRSGDEFIREPGQDGLANDEAKGVDCKMPEISSAVYKMKEQCSELDRDVEICIYSKISSVPLEKMSYEQLVAEGKNARDFKKSPDAIVYYEKACEKKKGSRACIDWAIDVYEANAEKGGDIFRKTCEEAKDKDVKIDCERLARDFMSGE